MGKNIRYVVSHIARDGLRRMTYPYQGRHTFSRRGDAEKILKSHTDNNTPDRLAEVYGPQCLGTFKVSAVECWPGHNDPKGCYIDKELNPDQDVPEPWDV